MFELPYSFNAKLGIIGATPYALTQGPELTSDDAPAARGEVGSALQGWESVLFHCGPLVRAFEELGALMYPPQVRAPGSNSTWQYTMHSVCMILTCI